MTTFTVATPTPILASPQAAMAPTALPPVSHPAAGPAVPGGAPTYSYLATPGGAQAYYYTYDKDDRLIPVQWVDWLFRGGREAGEPRPPLPIIGRLQGR